MLLEQFISIPTLVAVTLGTIIAWAITYIIITRYLGRMLKKALSNPEAKKILDEVKSGRFFDSVLEKPKVKTLVDDVAILVKEIKEILEERKKMG